MFNSEFEKLIKKHGTIKAYQMYFGCYYPEHFGEESVSSKTLYLHNDKEAVYTYHSKTYKPKTEIRTLLNEYFSERCSTTVDPKLNPSIDFHIPYIIDDTKLVNVKLDKLFFSKGQTVTIKNINCDTIPRAMFARFLKENVQIISLEDVIYELKLRNYTIDKINRDGILFEITFTT